MPRSRLERLGSGFVRFRRPERKGKIGSPANRFCSGLQSREQFRSRRVRAVALCCLERFRFSWPATHLRFHWNAHGRAKRAPCRYGLPLSWLRLALLVCDGLPFISPLCNTLCYTSAMRKSCSFRLPQEIAAKLRAISEKTGMSLTQCLILAIDRMAREEKCSSAAKK